MRLFLAGCTSIIAGGYAGSGFAAEILMAPGSSLPRSRDHGWRIAMIKVLMERDLPMNFDVADDAQAARHARIALDAITATQGKMHWLCTYATDDRKLFGLVVVENEQVIEDYVRSAGIESNVKIHRVVRVLDPSIASARAPSN
jgi:hypothetical protein